MSINDTSDPKGLKTVISKQKTCLKKRITYSTIKDSKGLRAIVFRS